MKIDELQKELVAIKCLNLLFYNYNYEMLAEMLTIREFKHCWDNYLDESKATHMQIWEFYLLKNSIQTQAKILSIAYKYYYEQSDRIYQNAIEMRALLDAHVKKHDALKKA